MRGPRNSFAPTWRSDDAAPATNGNGHLDEAALDQVRTAILLASIIDVYKRFVWLPDPGGYLVLGLFTLVTHAIDAFGRAPYLRVVSPERDCGKTQTLELLEALCARAWLISGAPSEAVVFRELHATHPTLLLDEIDMLFKLGDVRTAGLVSVLNSGYKRGKTVPRCTGEGANIVTTRYEVFGPKVICGISTGAVPEALLSRTIPITLHRLPQGQRVQRWRSDREYETTSRLRDLAADWATAHIDARAAYRCPQLDALSGRSEEIWEPMLAVAARAGREQEAIDVAIKLASVSPSASSSGGSLLAKLRDIIRDDDVIATADALRRINEDETLPFAGWNDGDGMRPRDLARTLGRYGVAPTSVRRKGFDGTVKGYRRSDLAPAWETYAPTPTLEVPEHPEQEQEEP